MVLYTLQIGQTFRVACLWGVFSYMTFGTSIDFRKYHNIFMMGKKLHKLMLGQEEKNMNRLRYFMFVMTVTAVLVLSAVQVVPARADDGAPPPVVDIPVEVAPPVEEPVEVNPTEEVPTEIPVVVEESVTPTDAPSTDDGVSDLLASIPEGTDVVVTNVDQLVDNDVMKRFGTADRQPPVEGEGAGG